VPADDLERPKLAQHPAVSEADDDVRHHPHRGRNERREGCLEVGDRPVKVIDLADRRLGSDHIEHRIVDPRSGKAFGPRPIHQARVGCDAQIGEVGLESRDRRQEALERHLVPPVRAARQKKSREIAGRGPGADLAFQHLRPGRGNHRLQNLRLAMVAVERARATRDRERRKAATPAAFEVVGRVGAKARRRCLQGQADPRAPCPPQTRHPLAIELQVLERLDRLQRRQYLGGLGPSPPGGSRSKGGVHQGIISSTLSRRPSRSNSRPRFRCSRSASIARVRSLS
jgi:hypothetical protein